MLAMSNILQRYEASVKLKNNKVVIYHNINTGLKKFHQFIKAKFGDSYVFYTVRHISSKEIVGTFTNDLTIQLKAVRVSLPKQRNNKNSGFFVRFPFVRGEALINRNLFFSDKIIVDYNDSTITLFEDIYTKAVINAKQDLHQYFVELGHIVANEEIELGDINLVKLLIPKIITKGTEPQQDFP